MRKDTKRGQLVIQSCGKMCKNHTFICLLQAHNTESHASVEDLMSFPNQDPRPCEMIIQIHDTTILVSSFPPLLPLPPHQQI